MDPSLHVVHNSTPAPPLLKKQVPRILDPIIKDDQQPAKFTPVDGGSQCDAIQQKANKKSHLQPNGNGYSTACCLQWHGLIYN